MPTGDVFKLGQEARLLIREVLWLIFESFQTAIAQLDDILVKIAPIANQILVLGGEV